MTMNASMIRSAAALVWSGFVGLGFGVPTAQALVTLDGTGGYADNADDAPFEATGAVYRDGGFTSSGVLIAPDVVVAASHDAVTTSNGTFVIGGQTYDIATRFTYDADSNDLDDGQDSILYTLTAPVVGIAPAPLYTGSLGDTLGTTAFYTGLGDQGTGSSPPAGGAVNDVLLVGNNVIDQIGGTYDDGSGPVNLAANLVLADFDDGSSASNELGTSLTADLEVGLALGDSGGGLFVYNPVTLRYELAGTHSAVIGDDFGYGQVLVSTAFTPQDLSTLQSFVPEPTSLLLAAGGVLLFAGRRR
jgi:hypothetical protein